MAAPTLCLLHEHQHHAGEAAELSELCCSLLPGVKEQTGKEKEELVISSGFGFKMALVPTQFIIPFPVLSAMALFWSVHIKTHVTHKCIQVLGPSSEGTAFLQEVSQGSGGTGLISQKGAFVKQVLLWLALLSSPRVTLPSPPGLLHFSVTHSLIHSCHDDARGPCQTLATCHLDLPVTRVTNQAHFSLNIPQISFQQHEANNLIHVPTEPQGLQ